MNALFPNTLRTTSIECTMLVTVLTVRPKRNTEPGRFAPYLITTGLCAASIFKPDIRNSHIIRAEALPTTAIPFLWSSDVSSRGRRRCYRVVVVHLFTFNVLDVFTIMLSCLIGRSWYFHAPGKDSSRVCQTEGREQDPCECNFGWESCLPRIGISRQGVPMGGFGERTPSSWNSMLQFIGECECGKV